MTKKIPADSWEFEALKKAGLELETPQDEFSYQPDSGSTANGEIGKQEYGIDVDEDALGRENQQGRVAPLLEDPSIPIPGESAWSQEHRLPEDGTMDKGVVENDAAISAFVHDQLVQQLKFKQLQISVQVNHGVVSLAGNVPNDFTKRLIGRVVAAIPGVTDLDNRLAISQPT